MAQSLQNKTFLDFKLIPKICVICLDFKGNIGYAFDRSKPEFSKSGSRSAALSFSRPFSAGRQLSGRPQKGPLASKIAQFWCNLKSFRISTCANVHKC